MHRVQISNLAHLIICRGVAAKPGCVHLMYRKLGQIGGARTHPKQCHPVPQGSQWLTTGSPQTLPPTQHSLDSIKMHIMTSVPFHCNPNIMTPPASCMGGATPPPHNHQPFTSRQVRGMRQRSNITRARARPPPTCTALVGPRAKHHFGKPCQSHIQTWRVLTHPWTAHGQLGTPTTQIRPYCLFFK